MSYTSQGVILNPVDVNKKTRNEEKPCQPGIRYAAASPVTTPGELKTNIRFDAPKEKSEELPKPSVAYESSGKYIDFSGKKISSLGEHNMSLQRIPKSGRISELPTSNQQLENIKLNQSVRVITSKDSELRSQGPDGDNNKVPVEKEHSVSKNHSALIVASSEFPKNR